MHGGAAIIGAGQGPGHFPGELFFGAERVGAALAGRAMNERSGESTVDASATDDDRLLAAIAGGSNAAFAELMARHLNRVFSLALRITGSRADAEDAAQEAFARVWRKAPDWQPGAARFSTWLYRVTMNLCIDTRRKPRAEQLDPDLPLADPGESAEGMLIERERQAQINAAMAELPERQRQAMTLCYTMGLGNAAAAEIMEISVKAYESLLVRAKRDIRARMEGLES